MPFDPGSVITLETLYNEGKFWIAFIGVLWTVFKAANWIKSIKNTDLPKIQTTLDNQVTQAEHRMSIQTEQIVTTQKESASNIVRELTEMRQDFRTYSAPRIVPARSKNGKRVTKAKARAAKASG